MEESKNDELLGQAAANGDKEAHMELYNRYVNQIYKFVYFRVGTKELAEDVVSEIFLKTWRHRKKYQPQKNSSYKSWLYTIARRQLIDSARKSKPELPIEAAKNEGVKANPTDPYINKILLEALSKLTPTQQDILRMRFWHELSFEEIANVLNKSSASCRMQASRAVTELRKTLPSDILIILMLFIL